MLQVTTMAKLDPTNFCFWLQGFCEIHGNPPTKKQWEMIKEHLEMCFDHAQVQSNEALDKDATADLFWENAIHGKPIKDILIC